MAAGEFEQAILVLTGGYPSERIGWRSVEQHPRARGNRCFQSVKIDFVAATNQDVGDLLYGRVRHGNVCRAVGPGGRENDGFVAWIEHATDSEVQRLNAGCRDDDLRGGIDFDLLQ